MLVKYPRTYHLPWSLGATNDDKVLKSIDHLHNQEVVVSVKMDGENTTLYRETMHARSTQGSNHPSRDWLKSLHSSICRDIPEGWRICGENLYAQHSISYSNLDTYFMVFSIWNGSECLSWKDTEEWCSILGLQTVPVLYQGIFVEDTVKSLFQPQYSGNEMEGYVVRLASSFPLSDFGRCVAKFVRANHVTTDSHWRHKTIVPNTLRKV